jgi:hypothetical protein
MTDLQPLPLLPDDPAEAITPRAGVEADAIGFIRKAIDTLSQLVEQNSDDIEGLARTDLLAMKIKRELDLLIEQIRPHLIRCMGGDKQIDLDGIGRLQRRTGVSYSAWDHDEVWRRLRSRALSAAANSDGEVLIAPDVIDNTIALVRDVITKGSYKATGLRSQLGVDPDEVSSVRFGEQTVIITGGSK